MDVRGSLPARSHPDILEHRHLTWTETFKIISGVAYYKVDGVQQTAVMGDTIVVPPGQPHIHPWNAGDSELVFHQVTRFAQANTTAVQEVIGVFATLFGLAGEGKVGRQALPKNPYSSRLPPELWPAMIATMPDFLSRCRDFSLLRWAGSPKRWVIRVSILNMCM